MNFFYYENLFNFYLLQTNCTMSNYSDLIAVLASRLERTAQLYSDAAAAAYSARDAANMTPESESGFIRLAGKLYFKAEASSQRSYEIVQAIAALAAADAADAEALAADAAAALAVADAADAEALAADAAAALAAADAADTEALAADAAFAQSLAETFAQVDAVAV